MGLTVNMKVSRREAKYLALLYREQIEESKIVTTTILAKLLKVTPATVTECFQKLAKKDLVEYKPYYGVKLTHTGIDTAEKLLRKHRLLETMLVRLLKYSPTTACREAARIDYYCTETLTNSICSIYNHPIECPCEKKIFEDPSCRRNST